MDTGVNAQNRPPTKLVQGVPFINSFADQWPEVERFQARPDDLLICTYPKAGTTWCSEIVDLILNKGDVEKTKRDAIYIRVPFLEFAVPGIPTGTELLAKMASPRAIKTHLPVQLLPKTFRDNNCKVIYVARNAKDVAVSYYYFYQMAKVHPEPGTWEEFLEKYMSGKGTTWCRLAVPGAGAATEWAVGRLPPPQHPHGHAAWGADGGGPHPGSAGRFCGMGTGNLWLAFCIRHDWMGHRRLDLRPCSNIRMEGSALVPRLDLKVVRGYPLLRYFADNMPQVDKWEARADDLLVSTYPKSGTTWISEVIDMLFNEGDTKKCKRDVILKRVPFLEFATPGCQSGPELLAETPSPRVVKTHLPVKLLPPSLWEKNCKMIYVARNAKDVAVSFYHFYGISKLHPDPGTWDDFLNKFMAGTVSYGSWYEHVKEWWDRAQKYRILYLFYEDMQEDPRREICKVATFLGMDVGDDIVEKINTHTAFKQMKDNPMANYDGVHPLVVDLTLGPFMRKGITGDWKNHFTEAQNKRFDEDYKRQMSGTTLRFRTEV